ncbi:MAG: polysaccharide biosynthesis/export family protein [Thalassotalea sp.]|nr:polysaccharide biosynthesis/export family protein [Thalassotalea sp.]
MTLTAKLFSKFLSRTINTVKLFISLIVVATSFQTLANDEYRLDAGDTISISVFGEPELGKQTLLSDSGKITYPF